MTFFEKADKTYYGIIVACLLPFVGFIISYYIGKAPSMLDHAKEMMNPYSSIQQDILIMCLIPNMFLFYFTNFRWNMYQFTKGLVATTILMGLALFIFTW